MKCDKETTNTAFRKAFGIETEEDKSGKKKIKKRLDKKKQL